MSSGRLVGRERRVRPLDQGKGKSSHGKKRGGGGGVFKD